MAKTMTGTVKKSEIETGVWVLETDDGVVYQLADVDQNSLQHGIRAEVEGDIDQQSMSFAMTGPILKVKKLTPK